MKVIDQANWIEILQSINTHGYARIPHLLTATECQSFIDGYDDGVRYRNVISMERYRFGAGEYKYFKYPLPGLIAEIREQFYTPLSQLANQWSEKLSMATQFPRTHELFLNVCHEAGQARPTPLILKYGAGGYNTLHQDLYGDVFFPFQLVIVLTRKGVDHEGGEFVLTEQLPRAQSKATVIAPEHGEGIIFTTNYRPVVGKKGSYKVRMKHGISEVTKGSRYAVGIIFHDAS